MTTKKSDHPTEINERTAPIPKSDVHLDVPDELTHLLGGSTATEKHVAKSHTYSSRDSSYSDMATTPGRRASQNNRHLPEAFMIENVDEAIKKLLKWEDTDGNFQVTIDDRGSKAYPVQTARSAGFRKDWVYGNYAISNMLQELSLAKQSNHNSVTIWSSQLEENPVERLLRMVREQFWKNLTRCIDAGSINNATRDDKDWNKPAIQRIYVPRGAPEQYDYYQRIAAQHPDIKLVVEWLAENPEDPEYVRDLNKAPGLLAIEMERLPDTPDGRPDFKGLPFIVPGGRFNELYGWDSYMASLGLLINGRVDLCVNMVKHFCFCIQYYGKILNANRTYYLCRTQPPFLTDMALRVHEHIHQQHGSLEFLRTAMFAAIKDYYTTWTSGRRYDEESGLSCYRPDGRGVPPETEATHFQLKLKPFYDKHHMTFEDFVQAYNYGKIKEPELDEFFRHDRSVRESGHDTSYRLEGISADLATVDLNSCLYKYEVDIGRTIRNFFGDKLEIPDQWRVKGQPQFETSSRWDRRARKRRAIMNNLMWSEEAGMFFDYNVAKKKKTEYESVTTFWAMWAGIATAEQANALVYKALPLFEVPGGLVSGTKKSRGVITIDRPNRQWDYPFGWAPHQILAWTGFVRYNFNEVAQRLAYKWLHMVTVAFYDYNGVVVENYDVTRKTGAHKVEAEYGNQGGAFKGVATEGFGWMNASVVYGVSIISAKMQTSLGMLANWESFQRTIKMEEAVGKGIDKDHAAQRHLKEAATEKTAPHVQISIPHSNEDESGHKAVHGLEERKAHKAPDGSTHH